MPTRQDIVTAARSYLGTPFHHQGRLKGVGLDCAGLIIGAAQDCGIHREACKIHNYPMQPDGSLRGILDESANAIPIDQADIGDILLFWISKRGTPQHLAIKTDIGMIHTYADVGFVVEHSLSDRWAKRICGAYRYPGI